MRVRVELRHEEAFLLGERVDEALDEPRLDVDEEDGEPHQRALHAHRLGVLRPHPDKGDTLDAHVALRDGRGDEDRGDQHVLALLGRLLQPERLEVLRVHLVPGLLTRAAADATATADAGAAAANTATVLVRRGPVARRPVRRGPVARARRTRCGGASVDEERLRDGHRALVALALDAAQVGLADTHSHPCQDGDREDTQYEEQLDVHRVATEAGKGRQQRGQRPLRPREADERERLADEDNTSAVECHQQKEHEHSVPLHTRTLPAAEHRIDRVGETHAVGVHACVQAAVALRDGGKGGQAIKKFPV